MRPADALAALERAVRSPSPPKLVATVTASSARADEPFLHERAVRIVREAAAARGAETTVHDAGAPGFDAGALYAALTTGALFASASLRVVRNADAVEPGAPLESAALRFARGAPTGDQLVLQARRLRAPFLKEMREAEALVVELRPPYDRPFRGDAPPERTELGEMALSIAAESGVKLAPGALGEMLRRTGSRLGAVAAAIEKLRAVGASAACTREDVARHVPRSQTGSPWALAEAIGSGDAARALEECAAIASNGARDSDGKPIAAEGAFAMAMAALGRDGRRNAEAADRMRSGETIEQAAAALRVPPFPAAQDAFARAIRARSVEGHRRFLDELVEVELAIRLRGEKPRSALERLAARTRARTGART